MKELELYIHIPFCVRKCKYCDFLSGPADAGRRQAYVDSLCRRIRSYAGLAEAYHIISIFVGGGTPSVLTGEQIRCIFAAIRETFSVDSQAEITLEANPGTLTGEDPLSVNKEKIETWKEVGINRLSLGLQSADERELSALGRIHTFRQFEETYHAAVEAGFENINVDLMSAVPFQTKESWERTLRKTAELVPAPVHISAYSLIIEEGTPFYERYGNGRHREELPDEETEREMYQMTEKILMEYGYARYEISNYAKPGYECRHNLGYWDRTEYLGIGTGAASLMNDCRWVEDGPREVLSEKEKMEEFMFLGLRKMEGVSVSKFRQQFGTELKDVYKEVIDRLCRQGLLTLEEDRLKLTRRGIDISNFVMSEFLLDGN